MREHDLQILRKLLDSASSSLASAQALLNREMALSRRPESNERHSRNGRVDTGKSSASIAKPMGSQKVVEGVFDGSQMIGPDGQQYHIPENYASKTKLLEGDVMKLTIMPDGTFLYKQIQQTARDRLVGVLIRDEKNGEYAVLAKGKRYRVLNASVSFFKGQPGDEAVIVVPRGGESAWAALENIVKESKTEMAVSEPKPIMTTDVQPVTESHVAGNKIAPDPSASRTEITLDELEDIDEL